MAVENIKNVGSFGIGVIELIDNVADGVSLGDVFSVVGVLKKVKPAIDAVKGGKLLAEYANLQETEKQELTSWFETELDVKNDKVEQVIEQTWKVVLELNELVKIVKPVTV